MPEPLLTVVRKRAEKAESGRGNAERGGYVPPADEDDKPARPAGGE